MSLDWSLGIYADLGEDEDGEPRQTWLEVFERNITHNVTPMWKLAGCYEALYRWDGRQAREALPVLESARERMLADHLDFRAMNPPNGWGTYDGALRFLQDCIYACRQYPKATIHISA